MAIRITRDASNKWFFGNSWVAWLAQIASDTGGTATITNSVWSFDDVSIVEEAETPTDDDAGITYLVASGGTNGTPFNATNTITCTITSVGSVLNVTDITQDRTVKIVLQNQ